MPPPNARRACGALRVARGQPTNAPGSRVDTVWCVASQARSARACGTRHVAGPRAARALCKLGAAHSQMEAARVCGSVACGQPRACRRRWSLQCRDGIMPLPVYTAHCAQTHACEGQPNCVVDSTTSLPVCALPSKSLKKPAHHSAGAAHRCCCRSTPLLLPMGSVRQPCSHPPRAGSHARAARRRGRLQTWCCLVVAAVSVVVAGPGRIRAASLAS